MLHQDVLSIIYEYAYEPAYRFKSIVDTDKIKWYWVCDEERCVSEIQEDSNGGVWNVLTYYPWAAKLANKSMGKHYAIYKNPQDYRIFEEFDDFIYDRDLWEAICCKSGNMRRFEKNIDRINWACISGNEKAISFLEKHLDKVSWYDLSSNRAAAPILEKNISKVVWSNVVENFEEMQHIIRANLDKLEYYEWSVLSETPAAIDIIENNMDKVVWWCLSMNSAAAHILEKNLDRVKWAYLSRNEGAMDILKKNLDKVCLPWLARNKNPAAIKLLEDNLHIFSRQELDWKDIWDDLSSNPAALPLLEKYPENINWDALSENIGICEIDISQTIKENCEWVKLILSNK